MNAIIYAAGRATRLGPAFANQPKILLSVGGRSLLEWHINRLTELGIGKVSVITGYLREQVVTEIEALRSKYSLEIEELLNADYSEGSALSMNVSLPLIEQTTSSVLLMDGDVFYDTSLLRRLLTSPHRTALLIDTGYSTADDDPVLVPIRNGKPFEFLKRWKGQAEIVGESVGFFKVDREDVPFLVRETKRRTFGQRRLESYDEILRSMVKAGRFGFEDITGRPWTEIDFPKDVERARHVVLSACAGPAGTPGR